MPNRLASSHSPYLQLHADNPVDWFPWSEEALTKAKSENKPILLSIGYTACHWCHVMAHESFEDQETAALMNEHFINIKLDREERPDLDKIYQLSAQLLTRQPGGWPLTVFLTPEKLIPFFAGTYFPKQRIGQHPAFKEVLEYANYLYTNRKKEIEQQNQSFENIFQELMSQSKVVAPEINQQPVKLGYAQLSQDYDQKNGGFGGAPKFPMTASLSFLLQFSMADSVEHHAATQMLIATLKQIQEKGLYDHLGGGFFRYTVDEKWQIPHFEKMLYDNGLLLSLLCETSQTLGLPTFDHTIDQVSDWLVTEMQGKDGGFFASFSADSEGKEGKFYTWKKEQIKQLLTEQEYSVIALHFGLDMPPNFEHTWHLQTQRSITEIEHVTNLDTSEICHLITSAKQKLLQARNERERPQRDDKIIVAWNGLAIKALLQAGKYLGKDRYIVQAQKAIDFIHQQLWHNGRLVNVYIHGARGSIASLDDYVFLIDALFYSLQSNWRIKDYEFMLQLLHACSQGYEDRAAGGFFYSQDNEAHIIYRLKQYMDEAIPSSNGCYSSLLQQIGCLLGDSSLLQSAEMNLKNAYPHLQRHSSAYCSFLTSLLIHNSPTEIIIVRGERQDLSKWQLAASKLMKTNRFFFFIPNTETLPDSLSDKKAQPSTTIAYYCRGQQCLPPLTTLADFEYALRTN